jgi:hypothetical protein
VPGGGGRWSCCLGELRTREERRASRYAPVGARAATRGVGLRRSWPEEAAPLAGTTDAAVCARRHVERLL